MKFFIGNHSNSQTRYNLFSNRVGKDPLLIAIGSHQENRHQEDSKQAHQRHSLFTIKKIDIQWTKNKKINFVTFKPLF